jgi:hypothetical protein
VYNGGHKMTNIKLKCCCGAEMELECSYYSSCDERAFVQMQTVNWLKEHSDCPWRQGKEENK